MTIESRMKDNSNVAIGMNYDVASVLSWSKSICNPDTCIIVIKGPPMTQTS
jgi:hypothetical protein